MKLPLPNKKENLKGLPQGFGIEWLSKQSFACKGHNFNIPRSYQKFLLKGEEVDPGNQYLAKTPDIIQRYLTLFSDKKRPYSNIVELGIFRGGSAAFVQLVAKPDRLLALELSPDRVAILDEFIAKEGFQNSLRAEYGVNQADVAKVNQLTTDHLGEGRSIDLVLDDASHMLAPTRTSFEILFPRIRPGGSYVVEDYAGTQILNLEWLERVKGGDKQMETLFVDTMRSGMESDQQPLHMLAVEAMLASIAAPGLVSRVIVDRHWLRIVRGGKEFDDPTQFDLRELAADDFGLLDCGPSTTLAKYLN